MRGPLISPRRLLLAALALAACSSHPGSSGSSGGATGAGSGGGSTGSPESSYGVVERGGGPLRASVFQDSAFTTTALDGGLHVDKTFTSANWSGPVFSQPLYFIDSATSKSMLVVTTDMNEVVAVDPATGATIWADLPGGTNALAAAVPDPAGNFMGKNQGCAGSVSPYGITGTPVIDPVARVLYLDAASVVSGAAHHLVYAIDLDDGSIVSGWPVDLDGRPLSPATSGNGKFQSYIENQRGALALVNRVVYVPFGGLDGDCGDYAGAVAAVPVADPSSAAIWATAAKSGSGIWGPSGVASDGTSVYVSTGNTNSDGRPTLWSNADSEAVIRLVAGNPPVFSGAGTDYFAPSDPSQNWYSDDVDDADLGSSGVVLFDYPGSSAYPHLAFAIGKTGNAYLLDRTNLGGLSTGLSELSGASAGVFGSMAAYTTPTATYVTFGLNGNGTHSFAVSGDPPQLAKAWTATRGGTGSPIVTTSDGSHDWLVWATDGKLTALDGDTGKTVASLAIPDSNYTHWVTPIVANGALYLAGNTELMKFVP